MKRSTIRGTPGFAPLLLLRHPNAIKRYCLPLSGFLVSETLHSGFGRIEGVATALVYCFCGSLALPENLLL